MVIEVRIVGMFVGHWERIWWHLLGFCKCSRAWSGWWVIQVHTRKNSLSCTFKICELYCTPVIPYFLKFKVDKKRSNLVHCGSHLVLHWAQPWEVAGESIWGVLEGSITSAIALDTKCRIFLTHQIPTEHAHWITWCVGHCIAQTRHLSLSS